VSSRLVVHGLDNRSVGELRGICSRGWTLIGDPNTRPGGRTTIQLSEAAASNNWLQLGRIVTAHHETLPTWAGVIDTPWDATVPVTLTIYNVEYLFNLRTPESSLFVTGTTGDIVQTMIEQINAQEETYLRIGVVDDDVSRQETLDERPYWEQVTALMERAGMEMQIRPVREEGRLYLYVDVLHRVGRDTGFLFHDGDGGNMKILEASINNELWNRAIGIGDESTRTGRKRTPPISAPDSARTYRMRSRNVQFNGVSNDSTLLDYTGTYVSVMSRPLLEMRVLVADVGEAFANVAVGNTGIFHSSRVYLPGGQIGWRGEARMKAIAFDEKTNTVGMTVEAEL
jgi:hypothetical protein